MNTFLLDASALAKRYTLETGSQTIDRLFAQTLPEQLICLMLGAAEVASVLVRRRNAGMISSSVFGHAMARLRAEVVDLESFLTFTVSNDLILSAWTYMDRYSLNATDCAVLRLAVDLAADLRTQGDDLVLVASDQRLLRAAQSEGLATFDPETDDEARLETLIGA